jgi:hypothetical protein
MIWTLVWWSAVRVAKAGYTAVISASRKNGKRRLTSIEESTFTFSYGKLKIKRTRKKYFDQN